MTVYELAQKRRTIRRFQPKPVPRELLTRLVDAARLAPSAMNLQPLQFILIDEPDLVDAVFPQTSWAGYLPGDSGRPDDEHRPRAFIAVLKNLQFDSKWASHDIGAAVQNMILTALEEGIGACWLGSVKRRAVSDLLNIPDSFELDSVVAFGFPAEEPVPEALGDSVKYYKDDNDRLHVPKRTLDSVLHINQFNEDLNV